jgi:hypothetical protein
MGVATTAAAAASHHQLLAVAVELAHQRLAGGVFDRRSEGDEDPYRLGGGAMTEVARAGAATPGGQQPPTFEMGEAGQTLAGDEDDVAAATAIATIGAAAGDVFVASKGHGAGPSRA